MPDEITFEDPRTVLKRHGLRPKKSWGQNFLVSRGAVEKISRLCVDIPGRHVVEIGAGLGTLTGALLCLGGRVTAVERDPEMCDVLKIEMGPHDSFSLREDDAATFDFSACLDSEEGVVAGNLPYQITGRILRNVLSSDMPLLRAVFMVQLEVAQRLCSKPGDGDRGALSAMTQARCATKIALRLAPTALVPRPRVRSAVVDFTPHREPLFGDMDGAVFDKTVKAAFANRRKTIRNSLLAAGVGGSDLAEELLRSAGIDPGTRAERLENEALVSLAQWAQKLGARFLSDGDGKPGKEQ